MKTSKQDPTMSIERVLEEAQFQLQPSFNQELHQRLIRQVKAGQSARVKEPRRPQVWQWASGIAIAICLTFTLMFAAIPTVRAEVMIFLQRFGVTLPSSDKGMVLSAFEPLAPEGIPAQMTYFISASWTFDEVDYTELRYFSDTDFLVVYESLEKPGEALPAGEAITIGELPGVLERDQNGVVMLAAHQPQMWRTISNGGGGGGGGGGSSDAGPQQLPYTAATKLTWFQSGVHVEMLTNLPLDQAVQLASSMHTAKIEP
jgi:hypothetical protein